MSEKKRPPCKRYIEIFNKVCIEGRTAAEAARELGIKAQSVRDIVCKVKAYLRGHGAQLVLPDVKTVRAINVREMYMAQLVHLWHESMAAWYRSQQPQETEKAGHVEKPDGQRQKHVEKVRKSQAGDPRFLWQAKQILAEMSLLQGMSRRHDSPSNPEEPIDVEFLTIEQREAEVDRQLAELGHTGPATTDAGTDPGQIDLPRAA